MNTESAHSRHNGYAVSKSLCTSLKKSVHCRCHKLLKSESYSHHQLSTARNVQCLNILGCCPNVTKI